PSARSSPRESPQPLDAGANLLSADELLVDMVHPPRAVRCEQRREAVPVAHPSRRVGGLPAKHLDLEAGGDGLKVAHRFSPPSVAGLPAVAGPLVHDTRRGELVTTERRGMLAVG